MKHWILRKAAMFILFGAAMFLVFGEVVMLLWNALIPDIFHGPTVTFWQAVGLLVLSHILVRGCAGPWHGGRRPRHWKQRMDEKLATMAPEEREKFKAEWHRFCGWKEADTEKK